MMFSVSSAEIRERLVIEGACTSSKQGARIKKRGFVSNDHGRRVRANIWQTTDFAAQKKELTTRTDGSIVKALPKVKRLNATAKVIKRIMVVNS
jgi:hypothetical protein